MIASADMTRQSYVLAAAIAAAGCGAHGKVRVDTPAVEFKAPDISEITGVDEPDASEAATSDAAPEKK
jgi:hypothetical protein